MKKSLKSSLNKRSLDISFQHKNRASNKFSKENFYTWPKTGLALIGLIRKHCFSYYSHVFMIFISVFKM